MSSHPRIADKILSAPVGVTAACLLLTIFMGCMSLSMSIGCKTVPEGTNCQEGKVSLRNGQELDVYYPVPYASPPNLEITSDADDCEIIEQKADHFRIRYKGSLSATPHWKTCGLRCPPPGAAPTVIVTPPAPPPPADAPPASLPAPKPVQTP